MRFVINSFTVFFLKKKINCRELQDWKQDTTRFDHMSKTNQILIQGPSTKEL